jgi:hypothetical protein
VEVFDPASTLVDYKNTEEKRLDTGKSYRVVEAQSGNTTEER